MNIVRVDNYEEMSKASARYIIDKVKANPKMTLGLATGSTPKGTYQYIIEDHKQKGTSYQQISTFNLDEYIGLSSEDPNSYHFYMKDVLFNHIDLPLNHTHIPNGDVLDKEEECVRYEAKVKESSIDLQILGIGANGHIGFNEPGTSFQSETHVVALAESTREANARFFPSIDDVPTHAITMGIASIMASKEILLLVSGEAKSEALERLLSDQLPSEDFPASILKTHPRVTIIADNEALMATGITR
ncbi:glucosamine-6-phosphate deaminase [Alkalihalophilus marmarensis]|uniref:Glucosamine-6-phosphate deaminase n=1 Tax=Alkalihalophilus marmarensis DSM 21297 TaxID=1188261 RepID=U6SQK0_9BACI|nr:glucosamine-6-phosphate deaminase [Alkalihalophilus marmarensis]ERN53667.1 glucosamine-6-phosphate deaminase [Alkalihalophilus marmarensis DSM 21297]